MSTKHPVFFSMAACLILAASACVPPAAELPHTLELVTPTPEVFQPIDPSPTSSGSALPLTCQVTDLSVYINEEWGYCFAYPGEYPIDQSQAPEGIVRLNGPALDENLDPIHVSLEVTPRLVPNDSALAPMVDAYLSSFKNVTMPVPTWREPWMLGNERA